MHLVGSWESVFCFEKKNKIVIYSLKVVNPVINRCKIRQERKGETESEKDNKKSRIHTCCCCRSAQDLVFCCCCCPPLSNTSSLVGKGGRTVPYYHKNHGVR